MKVAFASLRGGEVDLPDSARTAAPVLVVMPFIDRAMAGRSAAQLAARAGVEGLLLAVEDADRRGFIATVNRLFRESTSEYFAYVAQDSFAGRKWLARALALMQKGGKGLLGFNDGKWMGMLAGFGLAERAWAEANYAGNLFFPGYVRHYADVELTVLALSERRYCYDPNCVLLEVDWDKDGAGVNAADRALYRARAAAGFDGRVADARLLKLFA